MYSLKKIESLMPTMVPKVVVGNPQYKVFNKVSSKKEGGKIN